MKHTILMVVMVAWGALHLVYAEMLLDVVSAQADIVAKEQTVLENSRKPNCEMKNQVASSNPVGSLDRETTSGVEDYCYCESNNFACNPNSPPPNCRCVCTKK